MILEDRVRLEVLQWGEAGQFPEGMVQVRLVMKNLGVDMPDDARALRIEITSLFQCHPPEKGDIQRRISRSLLKRNVHEDPGGIISEPWVASIRLAH